MRFRLSRFGRLAGALGVMVSTAAPVAFAQGGDGFLFRRPPSSVGLRFGFDQALARSDLFSSFVTKEFTLSRRNFGSLTFGADLAARLLESVDLVLGAAYAGRSNRSEYRAWLDQDDLPIEQRTTFQRAPLTVGLRGYLQQRGRSVGQLAWVPARRAVYAGAGLGAMWYRFRQTGDFVDTVSLNIFRDRLNSSGWTFTAYGLVGMEVSVGPRVFLTGETRFTWARASLGNAYRFFDRIDLSGLSLTAGVGIRQ